MKSKIKESVIDDDDEVKINELNDKQADFFEKVMYDMTYQGVKKAVMIGGIGSGKSVILAILLKTMCEEMPRSKIQFACSAVTQAKRSLTPGLKSAWRDFWNCIEYNPKTGEGEYVLWKKPPEEFEKPFEEPDDWDNCISDRKGTVIEFCGYRQDPDSHRGRNDDVLVIDEGSRFRRDWLKIAEGRVRANVGKFESPLHHLIAVFSNPNYNPEGDWMWDIEELSIAEPEKYAFVHTCTLDNVEFLPKGFIEDKKKTMHDLEYKVEVLGQRVTRIKNSYYAALNWDHHTDIDLDGFYEIDKDITAAIDFNVTFTSATLWQEEGQQHNCFLNAFVKEPIDGHTMAESLALRIIELLPNHSKKTTFFVTGDRNGLNTSAGSKVKADGKYETQFDQFEAIMVAAGFKVVLQPLNFNPLKNEVYNFIQDVLLENGREDFYLRFHPEGAKQALISMVYTPITAEFTKDKRSERRKSVDQELATHLSDTVDYYAIYVKNKAYIYNDGGFDIEFM